MQEAIDIIRFAIIAQLLLLDLLFLKREALRIYVLPAALFCFSVVGHLLAHYEPLPMLAKEVLSLPAFALPFFFWIFSKSLFDDDFRLSGWMFWLLTFLLPILYLNHYLYSYVLEGEQMVNFLRILHHFQSLFFIVLAISEAAKNIKDDLIVNRLQFRFVFIVMTASLISLTIAMELAFADNPPILWILIQKCIALMLTFYFASWLLEFKSGFFNEMKPALVEQKVPNLDIQLINQLKKVMEEEYIFKTEGLTISKLAETLEVKEYKLRQTINQQLGFRNFNEFLNSYRINAACDLLAQNKNKELTILEIAYEVGYKSLAPFNKAFKAITGMTPTEFRRQ